MQGRKSNNAHIKVRSCASKLDDRSEKVYLELNLKVHGIAAVIRYCKITLSDVLYSEQNLRGGFATLSALSTHNLPLT